MTVNACIVSIAGSWFMLVANMAFARCSLTCICNFWYIVKEQFSPVRELTVMIASKRKLLRNWTELYVSLEWQNTGTSMC